MQLVSARPGLGNRYQAALRARASRRRSGEAGIASSVSGPVLSGDRRSPRIIGGGDPRENMILIGLGSNLTTPRLPTSQQVLEEAIKTLEQHKISVVEHSSWYRSAPVPPSDQPWFVNGVARLRADLSPWQLLAVLHEVEAEFGRIRGLPNASRTLDLDLLAYDDMIVEGTGGLTLPHPRMTERAFVLQPLAELAPQWRHPVSGRTAAEMLASLPAGQQVEKLRQGASGAL